MTTQEDRDNRADQLNPNNDAYWDSRGQDKPDATSHDDDWDDDAPSMATPTPSQPVEAPVALSPIKAVNFGSLPMVCSSHGTVPGRILECRNPVGGSPTLRDHMQCPFCGEVVQFEFETYSQIAQPRGQERWGGHPQY
jgi:hypothetical protein